MCISRTGWWNKLIFLHADTNLAKLNVNLIIIGWVPHKWFDELSRLIELFLYADTDWIMFSLTTNLLCIFDICWVSIANVLAKNHVFLLVLTGKALELGFPK